MKIKTHELIGEALNWAVAVCQGEQLWTGMGACERICPETGTKEIWEPSTNGDQGILIIEREGISIYVNDYTLHGVPIRGWLSDTKNLGYSESGPTPLIAAMRCYVASKLGEEVDVPEELT
jgi:hypothetical protein